MEDLKLYNLIENFVFKINAKTRIIHIHPDDAKPLGYRKEWFKDKSLEALLLPQNKTKFNQVLQALKPDETMRFECEFTNKFKKKIWYRLSIICKIETNKKWYLVHFENIDELKNQLLKSEETIKQLKEINAINHQIIHSAQAIIIRLNIDASIVCISKGAENLLGYSNNVLVGKNWFKKIVPSTKFPQYQQGFNDFIKSKNNTRSITAPIICKDKTQKMISWKTNKIITDGKLIGTIGIGRDVTEITQKVKLLEESEKRFKNLAELTPIPISFIATNGDIVFFNKAYTKQFGYTIKEAPTVNKLIDISYENEGEKRIAINFWRQDLAALKKGLQIPPKRLTVYNKKGQKRIMEYSASINENFIYYAYLDITTHIEKEQLLLQSRESFKRIAESTPVAIAGLDTTTLKVVFANKQFVDVLGYTQKDINKMQELGDLLVYDNNDEKEQSLLAWQNVKMELLKNDKSAIKILERKIRCKNGVVKTFEVAITYDSNTIYGLFYDITERKIAEKLLNESREIFKQIAENTPVAIGGCDFKTFDVKFVNKAFIELFGYTQKEIEHFEDWFAIILATSKEDSERNNKEWQTILANFNSGIDNAIKRVERHLVCKDGTIKICQIGFTVSDGTIYGFFNDVTEQKQAEKLLKESEERFRNLAENLPVPVTSFHAEKGLIFANKKQKELLGYSNENIGNPDNFTQYIIPTKQSPNAKNKFLKTIEYLKKNKSKLPILMPPHEIKIMCFDGIARTFEISETIYGQTLYSIFHDITEQRKAEQKLLESEQRFRNIVEHLPIPLVSLNPISGELFSNKKHQALIGYNNSSNKKVSNLSKFSIDDLVDEDAKKHFVKLIKKTEKNDIESAILEPTYSVKILCSDRQIRTFEITENIFGQTLYTVFHDITDQLKANELLKESEQKFKALAENMPIAIGAYNTTGKTIFVNKHFTDITGYSIKDVPTIKDWYHHTQPNTTRRLEFYDYWNHTIESFKNGTLQEKPEIKASSRCKDGSFKYFTYSFSIYDDTTYILLIDITEEEKAKKQLEKSYQELRNLASHLQNIREEERKNISREIHDELGQQLTGIKMDVSAIFKKVKSAKTVQEIEFKQVLDMLNLSVKTVRKISSELRPSLLDDLGLSAAIEWQALEFTKRTGIICNFNNRLDNEILAPEIQSNLFRILQESLTNIMRHAQAKNVLIDLRNDENTVFVTISDDGRGFNKNLPTSTLGLLGMQERTIMMQGNFEIDSLKNKGTVVKISVPIKPISK